MNQQINSIRWSQRLFQRMLNCQRQALGIPQFARVAG
ncbi:hypothetical protein OYT1_ch2021 [Ferriphaselus amnicola]|uniref:Uncharacterized protein n=1 Tax=Ferriphaselus amnicola TaxID=1188319 RepID=A0A2Z6GDK7_9PROT|nr:hypothetical protein OYT1_ch2021 [Ferriphaselus amnicola]